MSGDWEKLIGPIGRRLFRSHPEAEASDSGTGGLSAREPSTGNCDGLHGGRSEREFRLVGETHPESRILGDQKFSR